jgi:hypothetical protein
METLYSIVGKSGMSILAENGHASLAKFYIPFYLNYLNTKAQESTLPDPE